MVKEVVIRQDDLTLEGHISFELNSRAWVIFAHGSGSSRKSSRNNWVAQELNKEGHATFLFDLLTAKEDLTYENRFHISLLARRLILATQWLLESPHYQGQPIVYFGASTGAGAALMAAAQAPAEWPLLTVISRGGRPDLAEKENLNQVFIPVLLIVGSLDDQVIELNEEAAHELKNVRIDIIEGATHLFEEPGKLAAVVRRCLEWLEIQLQKKNLWGEYHV
jgi:pimeloyl-ACP methyl ester carboxylesterase